MITFSDSLDKSSFFTFHIKNMIIGEYGGCTIQIKVYKNNKIDFSYEFGWMNQTFKNFIKMLKDFPSEEYSGYYSHSDETFEIKWFKETKTNLYLLVFFGGGYLHTLKMSVDDILQLPVKIRHEVEVAEKI